MTFKEQIEHYEAEFEDLDIIHKITHVKPCTPITVEIIRYISQEAIDSAEAIKLIKAIDYYYNHFEDDKDLNLCKTSQLLLNNWKYFFEKETINYIKKITGGQKGAQTKWANLMSKDSIRDYYLKNVNLYETFGDDCKKDYIIETAIDEIDKVKDKKQICTEDDLHRYLKELEKKKKLTLN